MNCKLIPQVVVTRVVLMPEPTVHVEAEITNYGNRDILLEGCLNVVCILAVDNDDADAIKDELLDKKHWEKEDWYEDGHFKRQAQAVTESPSGPHITLELQLKDAKTLQDMDDDDYSDLEDLYVFTYLQINRENLADKYDIDQMEMDAVSGWWRVGRILNDGDWDGSSVDELGASREGLPPNSLTSSSDDDDDDKNYIFDIQDFRDLEEVDCSNGGTPQ